MSKNDDPDFPFGPDDDADEGSTTGSSEGSSTSSSGGQSGQVEFKEFVGKEILREDLLSPQEKKRLLIVHGQTNEGSIKKQKSRRDEYKALKEGKTNLHDFRQAGMNRSGFKPHTILADKRQFSGSDKQVNPLGPDHISETNNDKQNELHNRYELQNRPAFVPRAAPKPSPFGK